MLINEVTYDEAQPIDSYGPGFFRVAGKVIEGPMIATGMRAVGWAGPDDEAALEALAGEVDVLFWGTGPEMAFAPKALVAKMDALGIGVEPMSTPAACRTYNVTLSEGRRVALAAMPI